VNDQSTTDRPKRKISPELRAELAERARRLNLNMTFVQRARRAIKGSETLGPEGRRERAIKIATSMSAEQKSERGRKAGKASGAARRAKIEARRRAEQVKVDSRSEEIVEELTCE
jgi:hypothetical protein